MTHDPDRPSHGPSPTPSRARRRSAWLLGALAPAAAAAALAGCGGSSSGAKVASLAGHADASAHHSVVGSDGVPDPDGRPRETLNFTNAQFSSLVGPWTACLRAHRLVDQATAKGKLAVAAKCEHLEPLPAWQLDPSNPQARAFIGRVVTCLMGRGYHARAEIDDQGGAIAIREWTVVYSPAALNDTPRRPVAAENACHTKALG